MLNDKYKKRRSKFGVEFKVEVHSFKIIFGQLV